MTFKEKSKAPDCRLPGPSGLPIIGNAHQLNIKRPHFTLTEMAHHHGPIYKMKLLTDHWVVVNTYDLAREVCVDKGREFSGRPESYRFTACIQNGKLHLLGDLKDKSILMRQLMAKAMSLSGLPYLFFPAWKPGLLTTPSSITDITVFCVMEALGIIWLPDS